MQKLEEILRAEEAARHALSEARERSAARLRDAETEARSLVADARAEANATAAAHRVTALEAADRESDAVRRESAQRLEQDLAAARSRMDGVVESMTRGLVG